MAEEHGRGYIHQPDDPRDLIYERPAGLQIKDAVDLRDTHHLVFADYSTSPPKYTTVYDQGSLGSCTANAIAAALRYGRNAESWGARNVPFNPSRMFIYYLERLINATSEKLVSPEELDKFLSTNASSITTDKGTTVERATIEKFLRENDGSEIRRGMRCLDKFGACSEEMWKYDDFWKRYENDASKSQAEKDASYARYYTPPAQALKEAKNYLPQTFKYYRIRDLEEGVGKELIQNLEAALSEEYPVIFGFDESKHCDLNEQLNSDGLFTGWIQEKEKLSGGHAVMAIGYDRKARRFLIQNSWGDDWGNDGYFYMPYEWFEEKTGLYVNSKGKTKPRADDFWVVRVNKPAAGFLGTDVAKPKDPAKS